MHSANPDMVSWWPGDGNANDIQDGNNGTLQGNITFTAGEVAQAFICSRPGDSASIGNPANLQLQNFTFDSWVKLNPATLTGTGPAVIGYQTGGYGFGVAGPSQPPRVSGELFLTQVGSSNAGPGPTMVISDQNWHHIAVTKDGGTVIFYLDGVASAPQSYNPTFTFTSNAFIAGSDQPDPVLWDEIEAFNRALTQTEIQAIVNAGSAGKCKPSPQKLQNISTRLNVLTGDNVLIGGFIITGSEPKKVIVRAIGPSLTKAGVAGALADPVLELHRPDGSVVRNDNWKATQKAAIIASTVPPTNDLESAIVATLAPGNYTAIVRGKNGGAGVGLMEAFDLAPSASSQLANISTRGFVDTGDNVMIGGFIVGGGAAGTNGSVLVRAIGPSLTRAGVARALPDPTLELSDANGNLLSKNDNWKATQQAAIAATGVAPTNDKESALIDTLAPGNYTAIVRGKNNTTGVALVEAYNLQ